MPAASTTAIIPDDGDDTASPGWVEGEREVRCEGDCQIGCESRNERAGPTIKLGCDSILHDAAR
jgi:hypothetical protein